MGQDAKTVIFYGYKFDLNPYEPESGYEDWYNDLIGPYYYFNKDVVKAPICITGTFSDCNTMYFLGVLETVQSFDWNDNPAELTIERITSATSTSDLLAKWKKLLRQAWDSLPTWEGKPPFDENLCKWLVVCDYY